MTGAGETGAALVRHPGVDKVAFTGSTQVGREIQRTMAGTSKRYTLELGGKAANIIFEDAAIDQAVEGIVNGIFFNQGHVCCAGSRLFVQESVSSEVVAKLKDRMQTLQIGNPLDKNTDIGAINSRAQLDTIHRYLDVGREEGAEVYQPACELPERGFWCAPTLFEGVSQSSRVVQEEIFGPVLAIQTFRTVDEAIKKANNTPYGLSGRSVERQGRQGLPGHRQNSSGSPLGQHVQQVRPDIAVRRLQGKRHGARRRTAGPRCVRRSCSAGTEKPGPTQGSRELTR